MEAKREMEEKFMQQYQEAWMKKQLLKTNPSAAVPWEP